MVRVKQGMEHHPSLIPRLLPSLMLHTVHKTFLYSMGHTCKAGEEPGNKAKLTSPVVQDRGYTCTYSSLVPRASHPSVCACSEAWGRGYTYSVSLEYKTFNDTFLATLGSVLPLCSAVRQKLYVSAKYSCWTSWISLLDWCPSVSQSRLWFK